MRKIKALMYNIIRELNLLNLIDQPLKIKQIPIIDLIEDNEYRNYSIERNASNGPIEVFVKYPFMITLPIIKTLLKDKLENQLDCIHTMDKKGVVNGLFAGSYGMGGILPIQVLWMPSVPALSLKTTGCLEKIIKESMEVACTLAWNYLLEEYKNKYLKLWEKQPMGFHIHCPEGAVPKDGPSAGAALTLAIYSLLVDKTIKHHIAITGEINLEGKISTIGGLEEKLEGAKQSKIKLVLIPKENNKTLEIIKKRNKCLIDDNFIVKYVKNFNDIIKYALN